MQNTTETNLSPTGEQQNIDETLRKIYRERNYFPEGYDDNYQPPSLDDDCTPKHAYNLIDEIFIGADAESQQKICELLRNISLSDDAARLAGLISRYAFVNYNPFDDDMQFSEFISEGKSYEPVN